MGKKISSGVPLTPDDLRILADDVDYVVKTLEPLVDYRALYNISAQISRQDSDEVVGEVKFYGGWLGFFPYRAE